MRVDLIIVGATELAFGVVAGAVGVAIAIGMTRKLLRLPALVSDDPSSRAVGIVYAATCIAMGLLLKPAVAGPFDALQLVQPGSFSVPSLITVGAYGAAHFAVTVIAGLICQAVGVVAFDNLTRGVDEVEAVRKGQIGAALVLGAVIVGRSYFACGYAPRHRWTGC